MTKRTKTRFAVAVAAAALALNAALWLAQAGLSLPVSLANSFFGPKMVRAEVYVKAGGVLHDYFVDRGKITKITPATVTQPATLTILERDGSLVTVPVAPSAAIQLGNKTVVFRRLKARMNVLTVRDGEQTPAQTVRATKP
jgi:hypothetical protein